MRYPFSGLAQSALIRARHEAARFGSPDVGTPHLLLGIVSDKTTVAGAVLDSLGFDLRMAKFAVEKLSGFGGALEFTVPASGLEDSLGLKQLIERAHALVAQFSHMGVGPEYFHNNIISVEHLLLALVEMVDNNPALDILAEHNISPDDVRRNMYDLLGVGLLVATGSAPTRDRASLFQTFQVSL